MPNLGPMELVLILGVALLLFGGRKLPELAKGMGEGIKNFKNALKEETPPPPTQPSQPTETPKP
ncbi:Sec-independent protein translocase subunit TatA/TatB, partial [Bryobacter aggregatus]|uniref:Sec-independent protein translocase subunit TatA/TatB n=1 Tax=Bryobacter aggregatus TaxID=360054 RepID=UPI0004E14AD6